MGSALNRATQGASPPSKTLRETPAHAQQGDDAKPVMEVVETVEGPPKVQQESKLPLIEETLQPVNHPLQPVNHPLQPVSHPVQEWLMKKHSGRVPIRQSLRQSLSTFDNSVYSENPVKAWGTLRSKLEPSVESAKQEADIKSQMQDCILGTGGELSALLRAANLGATYLQLDLQGRLNFQLVMVENFGPNGAQTEAAMETFRSDPQEAMIPPPVTMIPPHVTLRLPPDETALL